MASLGSSNDLSKLRDIHFPEAVSWWPPAIGWWVLGGLVSLLLGLLLFIWRRRFLAAKAKREALILLSKYQQQAIKAPGDAQQMAAAVSTLLRRVALAYFPRKEVAHLKDEAWLQFLEKTSKGIDFESLKPLLIHLPYQAPSLTDYNLASFFESAQKWIKQRGKPCFN